jgi:hypothetical protein
VKPDLGFSRGEAWVSLARAPKNSDLESGLNEELRQGTRPEVANAGLPRRTDHRFQNFLAFGGWNLAFLNE